MSDNIISYLEMCNREKASLQAGMNFAIGRTYSVILLSRRPNAPYEDRIEDGGCTLIYEGHDQPKSSHHPNPKLVDQPEFQSSGKLTQNGKFHRAAQEAKCGLRKPERVRAYEKIKTGIWTYNGLFHLVDSYKEIINGRSVFKFRLEAIEGEDIGEPTGIETVRRRIIPTHVKLDVWKRDGGRCVMCGATDELHFDHDLPWSKGGTSLTASNVQLLCARHNLSKGSRIK
jgi:hypothetical protein